VSAVLLNDVSAHPAERRKIPLLNECEDLEVSSAQVQSDIHISRLISETIIICLHIQVEQVLVVDSLLDHALDHRLGAEEGQQRTVELDIPCMRALPVNPARSIEGWRQRTASKLV